MTGISADAERRAAVHAALGEPVRVAVVDELQRSDRSPKELSALLGVAPSLLAFHLDALEHAGLIERIASSGDRRRRYVRLRPDRLDLRLGAAPVDPATPMLFVCTQNSARSQLAAAAWRADRGGPAASAGTEPADAVHPGAVAAAARAGLDLGHARPQRLETVPEGTTVVTVCDLAHEQLPSVPAWHWSIPDPAVDGTDAAFDEALDLIRRRITTLTTTTGTTPTNDPQEQR
ncbi:ArsR family transcriptional regulator [Ilumatobacter fluminis]|uniref:ArsR family transcriptional regulator n=1 Tax=Ilumatobacter fluminis TaxID=467091 RepID=A0A4R7HX60_9ACTN|nr:helix-turn-helix domain-containing protein [Ilumatobacter fluminis]TDT15320.1 ArsR family transcriptional regulator [Ilumatobacter fluminis]